MHQMRKALSEYKSTIAEALTRLDLPAKKAELTKLQQAATKPDFWSDPQTAEAHSRKQADLARFIESWETLAADVNDLLELSTLSDEADAEFTEQFNNVSTHYNELMITLKLSGEYDEAPAIMQITAGVGGTDAQDWAEMLLTMYTKYCEKNSLTCELVDISRGEEAGIKSATLEITGPFAFGLLKSEKGVHRLVRLSPYNAQSLRQTSFALVDVVPETPRDDIEINPADLRVDVYRASGHGGQSVNTTDSAVRITHIPTGTVVAIQNERSQLKNKEKAMQILASRLAELAREAHAESIAELRGKLKSADWGAQIRSYVLHPYTKVKDHRTDYETSDANGVLAGELTPFIDAYLNYSIKN